MTRLELLKEVYRILMEEFDGDYYLCHILAFYPGICGGKEASRLKKEIMTLIHPYSTFSTWYKAQTGGTRAEALVAKQKWLLALIKKEEEYDPS